MYDHSSPKSPLAGITNPDILFDAGQNCIEVAKAYERQQQYDKAIETYKLALKHIFNAMKNETNEHKRSQYGLVLEQYMLYTEKLVGIRPNNSSQQQQQQQHHHHQQQQRQQQQQQQQHHHNNLLLNTNDNFDSVARLYAPQLNISSNDYLDSATSNTSTTTSTPRHSQTPSHPPTQLQPQSHAQLSQPQLSPRLPQSQLLGAPPQIPPRQIVPSIVPVSLSRPSSASKRPSDQRVPTPSNATTTIAADTSNSASTSASSASSISSTASTPSAISAPLSGHAHGTIYQQSQFPPINVDLQGVSEPEKDLLQRLIQDQRSQSHYSAMPSLGIGRTSGASLHPQPIYTSTSTTRKPQYNTTANTTTTSTTKARVRTQQSQLQSQRGQHGSKASSSGPAIAYPEGLDPDLINTIEMEMVPISELENGFSQVIGLDDVKNALTEMVIWPIMHPHLFSGLRIPARGLLLYGPPGNGKTFIAKALAYEAKCTFFAISASSLTSKHFGEGEKLMKTLYTIARCRSPSVIFIDEGDALLSKRGESSEHEASRRLKTEFLTQVDGMASSTNPNVPLNTPGAGHVVTIVATNLPSALDDAVLRRLPKRIYVGPPDDKARASLILGLLKKNEQGHTLSQRDITRLIEATDGYSNSDLTALCRDASFGPLRRAMAGSGGNTNTDSGFFSGFFSNSGNNNNNNNNNNNKTNDNDITVSPITLQDFAQSLKSIKPSISREKLKEYEKFKNTI